MTSEEGVSGLAPGKGRQLLATVPNVLFKVPGPWFLDLGLTPLTPPTLGGWWACDGLASEAGETDCSLCERRAVGSGCPPFTPASQNDLPLAPAYPIVGGHC